jgi:hypothetical protein
LKPDTPYFEISAPQTLSGEPLKQSKVAPGMEICFIVTFRPQEVREYSWDLVCCTERENFIVPLRAIGFRPLLTLPDEIDFGPCPIKSATEKKIVIQNVGTSVAKFSMTSFLSNVLCPEQDIVIEAQGTYALELQFTPIDTSYIDGEIEVTFMNEIKCYIAVKGLGKNVEVSLSTPSLTLEPSYISLFSQKTLKIRNLSDAPIRYRWKSFATEDEEEAERERLLTEINRIEEEERAELHNRVMQGLYTNSSGPNMGDYGEAGFDYSINEGDPTTLLPFAARVDEAVLTRKYRNLRKALEADKMLFVDDIFDISPMEGEVWAHSEMEITVCFRPDTAAQFNCLAFLDVSGRHDRLALTLSGHGIGPNAALSFEVLDIGDVFVNDENFYELSIKNKGDIPAQWTFMSSLTKFGNKFQFSPTEGYLLPNQSQKIQIRFESDILGEFSEHFRFALQGNEDMLVCQIKGHVIGPTFHFDCTSIDFGTVSYDYLHSTKVRLVNTSKVPMVYTLHIPQDGAYLKKEFNIEPNRGTLAAKESVEVLIEFIPTTVKVYDYSLAVDVLGVGDILLSIPITAECIISTIKLDLPLRELDFGDCFIRYPYEKDLRLTNVSTVVNTKFEILPQPKQTLSVASYEAVPSVAVIEPGDTMVVKVRLIAQKLGPYKVPLTITIAGSQEPPMQAVIVFNSVGPKISVGCTELKWGNIECLKDSDRMLSIKNIGLISASMKLFLKMARSCYLIETHELVLEAQQSYDLKVIANLDDSVVNKDEIHIVVDEGDNLMVPLIAKGIGTTMYCKDPIDVLDLGVQLTNAPFEKQIVLENKGRRPQILKWTNKTVQVENAARLAKAKKLGKDLTQKLPKNLAPIDPCFAVSPEEITLRPRTATTFTFKGFSAAPRCMSEMFILDSKVGKERNFKQIMQTEVKCDVVNPLLEFSSNNISFLYTWEKDVDAQIHKADLVLTNTSSITLTFFLKTEIPFNLNTWEVTLEPGQKVDLIVEFDPLYRDDRQSHVVQKTLQINYRGHPQKDSIQLTGEVVFPNLKFDMSGINFGCVLNDTSKVIRLRAENSCKIDVRYEWIFLEQTTTKAKSRTAVFATPPSHVFDVLPVRSLISPGQHEDVEFTMLSTTNTKLQTTVICVVEGGPEYKFPIQGESSNVAFELDKSVIDFGKVIYTDKNDQELMIMNHGKVNYNFRLEPTTKDDANYLEFFPAFGKVNASQNLKVIVRMRPGIPSLIKTSFTVHIAHFDPVQVACYCQGIFPAVFVGLPRFKKIGPLGETENVAGALWDSFQSNVVSTMMQPDAKLLPPAIYPPAATGTTTAPPVYVEPDSQFPPAPPNGEEEGSQLPHLSSVTGSARGIAPQNMDLEMQRAALNYLLEEKLKALKNNQQPEDPVILQDYIAKYIELKSLVAARYICDFGNVIIGQTKKKIFKITNASLIGQLSWVFDKKHLAGTGFSIEPEKVNKLAESDSLEFTVKYFARTQQKIGPKSYTLPLEAPGAPTIHIIFTANVCLPEIELSSSNIDFGKVLIGRSVKMFLALKNPSPVTASWSFRKTGGRDETRFTITPHNGSLRPNKKTIVCLEFIPQEAHKCSAEFSLRIDQNKKSKQFKMIGEGISIPLKFEPQVVEINPVLPFSEGGEQIVTIQNPTDFPVEFFSIDFDNQYKEEETVLSAVNEFDLGGIFRSSLRNPGEKLPFEVLEAFQRSSAPPPSEAPVAEEIKQDVEEEGNQKTYFRVPPLRTKQGLRDSSMHQDIIVVGPPLSGVTTLANNLAKKLFVPVKTLDELFLDVALSDCDEGIVARRVTNKSTENEIVELNAKMEALTAAAEQSKLDAVEAYKKEKKGKAKEIPDEVYQTPQVQALNDYKQGLELTPDIIANILTFRLSWQDIGDGCILDGVFTKLFPMDMVLHALPKAFPGLIFAHIRINRGKEGYEEWIQHVSEVVSQERERLKKSIDTFKRLLFKSLKAVKGKSVESQIKELEETFINGIPEAIPTGDESWLDALGNVMELDANDYKALDEKEKTAYLSQILYQQSLFLSDAEKAVARIQKPSDSSLLERVDSAEAPAQESNEEKLTNTMPRENISYDEYEASILPILLSMPQGNALKVASGMDQSDATEVEDNKSGEDLPTKQESSSHGVYDILLEGEESADVVQQLALSQLPAPKVSLADKENELPAPEVLQVYRKPLARANRKAIKNFIIADIDDELVKPAPPVPAVVEPVSEPAKGKGKPAKGKVEEPPPPEPVAVEPQPEKPKPTRWIVSAQSSFQFKVRFGAEKEGTFQASMEFEIVGTGQKFNLPCNAICEYPKVNIDTRNVFMRRLKSLNPANPYPLKRFVIAENFYSFGSLALFKKPDWKKTITDGSSEDDKSKSIAIETTNSDIIRITNNGRYKCDVNLSIEYDEGDSKDCFLIEPPQIEIEEGETKEVRAWALPKESKEYKGTLVVNVAKNPTITKFPIRCWGSEPTAECLGPWTEGIAAAEEALAKNTDKKLVKDLEAKLQALKEAFTIDFDRVLIGKTELRTFQIKNTSLVPVAWEVIPEDFDNSPNIKISPMSGVVPYNTTMDVTVSFTSPDPLMLTGKFSVKLADAEGGLETARAVIRKFRSVAEAYKITAVSLNSEGKELLGTSEMDFGLARVGDYAIQNLKMGNKGKYKIGYAFKLTESIAEMIKIEPMEGTIDAGNALAEIKVTFCSKADEIVLKSNSEIKVNISEPTTGEIVETFPLLITAQAKYNRFRLQPSKGISFGAIRFDADPRVKRSELRNESKFEITYVVMPVSAEHDEIDDLDPSAFAAYACGVPAAMRGKELGEEYLKRLGGGGGGGTDKGGKKDAKPPVKGKGAPVDAPPPSSLNPLVQDPDSLALTPAPSDPLVVGAFTIHPRVATIQPGQAVSIDMKFDPSGCETVVEKLRICVGGADPNDPLTIVMKSFELVGESCLPAMVCNDFNSIFEEQEIVSSLAESTGENSVAGGKIEKLPVGKVVFAEAEKTLAFGPVSCAQSGRGVMERVKITNPTKIDIKAKFKVVSPEVAAALSGGGAKDPKAGAGKDAKGGKDAGKGGKKAEPVAQVVIPEAFVVQPESWEIPPHESRFVNIYFNPTEIKSYRSVFIAEIDDEGITSSVQPKVPNTGKTLTFDLGGSGTLPCISIEEPTDRNAEGQVVINFAKTLIERKVTKMIRIRNDGVMPATCLFEIHGDRDFEFPARGTSLTVHPGKKETISVSFAPREMIGDGNRSANIRISVLNNAFDQYTVALSGQAYSSDAIIDTSMNNGDEVEETKEAPTLSDHIVFSDINLTSGPGKSQLSILLKSRSNYPLKFSFNKADGVPNTLSFAPTIGHLAAFGTKEISFSFNATEPCVLENAKVLCSLKKIEYQATSEDPKIRASEEALWGKWDDAMKSMRQAYPEDMKAIEDYAAAIKDYEAKVEAEKAKGKKAKPVGPPPEKCMLELAPPNENGEPMIYEIVAEPFNQIAADYIPQEVVLTCSGVADSVSYDCPGHGETFQFVPTYIFQSSVHKFTFTNKSKVKIPLLWTFEDLSRRRNSRQTTTAGGNRTAVTTMTNKDFATCPFKVEPEECSVEPNESQEFVVKFTPMDAGDFLYSLQGHLFTDVMTRNRKEPGAVNMIFHGIGKRPVCHFDIQETLDYLSRREPNLKNENGLNSSIETPDLKIVEVESVGLKTRNTFRFYVTNTTNESYEFLWEPMGEASPFWRCVQGAGMMFPGKRIEMIFEYLPEDTHVAEAFFKFRLPKVGLQQIFLFAGKVNEPKVAFSTSKLDFHSVMLGGEGITETIYLENHEHLPFNYSFDKYSLMQLEGPSGPVLHINPKEGTVPPNGKVGIQLFFKPQEEVSYNYNVTCIVKRKPNKLSINVKGEGYSVHPQIQLEQTVDVSALSNGRGSTVQDKFLTLKPLPAVNIADYGSVQVLDSLAKSITVLNAGKYNFDYSWNIDSIGSMLALSGGKLNGTLLKGEELSYKLTFAPQREGNLEQTSLKFTVAGKYVYQIIPRGVAVKPALRFSFMHHDFGNCFITSPGGSTVIEEAMLTLKNHDPSSNISVECVFQKIRALWVECAPTVIPPGGELQVPIRFAPREVKEYSFAVPFMVNGTGKVTVNISGKGINARLELVNGSQRRTAFGLVNVGTSVSRTVMVINKSKRALPIQLIEGGEYGKALSDRCISFNPTQQMVLQPKETMPVVLDFKPTKRVFQFSEDLLVQYAGVTRTLVSISGKAQGIEVDLDSDSIPFGLVVLDSQKVKKLTLENTGDLTINFQWQESTFGEHFRIQPLIGKLLPGTEMVFDVIFKPKYVDEDIRQDNMTLVIPGIEPLKITCSGMCINPPTENIQTMVFQSLARKSETKTVKIANPSEKDWFLSPSLQGIDWKVPYEFKVPAKGTGEMPITYYPLTMASGTITNPETGATTNKQHEGKLFIALPDGSAQLYELRGNAGNPECSGKYEIETPAKKAATVVLKIQNWLGEPQKLQVAIDIQSKPSPATFLIAANATEVGPNGTKEFPVR